METCWLVRTCRYHHIQTSAEGNDADDDDDDYNDDDDDSNNDQ